MMRESVRLPYTSGEQPELSPCPFCGSDVIEFYEHSYSKEFAATCCACGCEGPKRPALAEAARLWNARAMNETQNEIYGPSQAQ